MLVDEDEQAPPPQRINVRVLINSSLRLQEQKLTDCLDGSFCYAMHLRPVFTTMIVIIFTVLGCSFFVSLLAVVIYAGCTPKDGHAFRARRWCYPGTLLYSAFLLFKHPTFFTTSFSPITHTLRCLYFPCYGAWDIPY